MKKIYIKQRNKAGKQRKVEGRTFKQNERDKRRKGKDKNRDTTKIGIERKREKWKRER